jgi:hypothetical protein
LHCRKLSALAIDHGRIADPVFDPKGTLANGFIR